MSDEKKYTERDLVMAKRQGWVACDREFVCMDHPRYDDELARSRRIAAERYPLPKVTRPRVVRDPEREGDWSWTVENGEVVLIVGYRSVGFVEYRKTVGDSTLACTAFAPKPARVALWADLLANPTEQCEVDE